MNKKLWMILLIIMVIAIIIGTMYLIDLDKMKKGESVVFSTWGAKYAPVENGVLNNIEDNKPNEVNQRILKVKEKLFYDTGKESTIYGRCGVMDGNITSNVPINEIPTENDQANFEGNYGYQYVSENTIEVFIDNKWIVFESMEDTKN